MRLAFVVCGNGFGHLKRVCAVVEEIFKLNRSASVLVLGASHHENALNLWETYERFNGFRFNFINADLESNLTITLDRHYSFEKYATSFHIALKHISEFEPQKVISDNLIGILNYRPDSLLMGSFLWPDILRSEFSTNDEIARICDAEDKLLERVKPVLLGVDDMVMESARKKTNFAGLAWFCNRSPSDVRAEQPSNRILVTGGGTGKLTEKLLTIAVSLSRQGWDVSVDQSLYRVRTDHSFSEFDFAPSSFSSLHSIICRPGIGILTDAVKYRIPVGVVDGGDPEMQHNAIRVEQLGIGVTIKDEQGISFVEKLSKCNSEMSSRIDRLRTGGAFQAASFILNS